MAKVSARRAARRKLKAHDRGEDRHSKQVSLLKKLSRMHNERQQRGAR